MDDTTQTGKQYTADVCQRRGTNVAENERRTFGTIVDGHVKRLLRGHHQRNVVKSDNCSLNIGLNFDDSSELRLQLRNESENEKMTKATSSEDRMIVA